MGCLWKPTAGHAKAAAGNLHEDGGERRLVTLNFASWNHLSRWLQQVEHLRRVAEVLGQTALAGG
jgi:hypothetical protein